MRREGCGLASCKKYSFDALLGPWPVQARGDERKTMLFQLFYELRTCYRHRYAARPTVFLPLLVEPELSLWLIA